MRFSAIIGGLVAAIVFALTFNLQATAQNGRGPMQNKASQDWVLVNEFGNSKCFVNRSSIEKHDGKVRALVMYLFDPPGTDRRNNKQVAAMINVEEYDLGAGQFRVHRIVFRYSDGTESEPLSTDLAWKPATGGNQQTLAFLQGLK